MRRKGTCSVRRFGQVLVSKGNELVEHTRQPLQGFEPERHPTPDTTGAPTGGERECENQQKTTRIPRHPSGSHDFQEMAHAAPITWLGEAFDGEKEALQGWERLRPFPLPKRLAHPRSRRTATTFRSRPDRRCSASGGSFWGGRPSSHKPGGYPGR